MAAKVAEATVALRTWRNSRENNVSLVQHYAGRHLQPSNGEIQTHSRVGADTCSYNIASR